jgi:enoyl-CoA hydratase/carnithine racemase
MRRCCICSAAPGGGGIDNNINAAICDVLEGGPKPSVAAITGVALGGGCEVGAACGAAAASSPLLANAVCRGPPCVTCVVLTINTQRNNKNTS